MFMNMQKEKKVFNLIYIYIYSCSFTTVVYSVIKYTISPGILANVVWVPGINSYQADLFTNVSKYHL